MIYQDFQKQQLKNIFRFKFRIFAQRFVMQCVQQAPESNSVQVIQVEAQGKKTHLIEKRKVKFVSYNPLTIIRTDKQIYNPGQTGIFTLYLAAVFDSCFYADLNMSSSILQSISGFSQWTKT